LADVNQLDARRRATEVVTNDFQWWRSQPDPNASDKAVEKLRSLEQERRALLTRLLGPNWEKSEPLPAPARTGIQLAGPVLGDLPDATKQQVYEIAERAEKNRDAYLKQQRQLGAGLDAVELAKLRRSMRSDLAKILSPEQLEEFLLRYSQTARDMRREFQDVELTPAEFRAIFRARDLVEQELALQGDNEKAGTQTHLGILQTQAEQITRQTLGDQRYNVLKLNQDPIFRETESVAENVGAMPEMVPALYEINRLVATEQQRIRLDPTLSDSEKIDALAEVQAEREKSFEQLLSPEAFQKWFQLQNQKP
jgi:hypothetical protein